jgi:hypothetical protein
VVEFEGLFASLCELFIREASLERAKVILGCVGKEREYPWEDIGSDY